MNKGPLNSSKHLLLIRALIVMLHIVMTTLTGSIVAYSSSSQPSIQYKCTVHGMQFTGWTCFIKLSVRYTVSVTLPIATIVTQYELEKPVIRNTQQYTLLLLMSYYHEQQVYSENIVTHTHNLRK